MAHRTTIDVRFAELDPYGHVNHAVYITYFEVGRTDALAACGLGLAGLAADGHQLVVTRIEVDYRRPAGPGETVVVESSIVDVRRASSRWRQRITRDGEELVTAEVTVAVTDRVGRPTRPPPQLFPALRPLLD